MISAALLRFLNQSGIARSRLSHHNLGGPGLGAVRAKGIA